MDRDSRNRSGSSGSRSDDTREGVVVRVRPRRVRVECDGVRSEGFLAGSLAAGPRRETNVVAVGDRVLVRGQSRSLSIVEVLPRRNAIARVDPGSTKRDIAHVLAANLDWFVVVASLARPALNLRALDRLLVLGEVSDIPCAVVLNKADLAPPFEVNPERIYSAARYPVIRTSAATGAGVEELRRLLAGRVSLLSGASGVGKTSLLNALFPDLQLPTNPVSVATGKGVHTTTRVEWIDLPGGGAILDSPGVRSIQPFGLTGENLDLCFPEIAGLRGRCQFNDCRHRDEPGCAVRRAVESGEVPESRYEGYCRILQGVDRPAWWRRSIGS